jgi:hypothetical protein
MNPLIPQFSFESESTFTGNALVSWEKSKIVTEVVKLSDELIIDITYIGLNFCGDYSELFKKILF